MAKGMFLALTNCTDSSKHDEFNRWYGAHTAQVLATKGLVRVRRYTNARPSMGPSQYLAVYEYDADDLTSVDQDLRMEIRRRSQQVGIPEYFEVVGQYLYSFIPQDEYPEPPAIRYPSKANSSGGASRPKATDAAPLTKTCGGSLYMVMSNCADPTREEEFNSWYNYVHVPDLTPARGIVGGTRWRNVVPRQAGPRTYSQGPSSYAAVYEFADDDLVAAMSDFQRLGTMTMDGRIIDCMQSVGMWWWWEIDATAYR